MHTTISLDQNDWVERNTYRQSVFFPFFHHNKIIDLPKFPLIHTQLNMAMSLCKPICLNHLRMLVPYQDGKLDNEHIVKENGLLRFNFLIMMTDALFQKVCFFWDSFMLTVFLT